MNLVVIFAKRSGNIKLTTMRFELNDMTENSQDTLQELIRKHDPSELIIYDFDSILIATSNFSINNKLGGGGFGPVYKVIILLFLKGIMFYYDTGHKLTTARYRHEFSD